MFWDKENKTKEGFYGNFLKEMGINSGTAEEEKKKILAVLAYLNDGVLMFDKDGILSLINPQAEKFLDVKRKEVLGKQILELNTFPRFQLLLSLVGFSYLLEVL